MSACAASPCTCRKVSDGWRTHGPRQTPRASRVSLSWVGCIICDPCGDQRVESTARCHVVASQRVPRYLLHDGNYGESRDFPGWLRRERVGKARRGRSWKKVSPRRNALIRTARQQQATSSPSNTVEATLLLPTTWKPNQTDR